MAETQPIAAAEILRRAASAVGKIDHWGFRGVSMISADEIEAKALLLAALGLPALHPGDPLPDLHLSTLQRRFE